MPREIILIQVGQSGNQIGWRFWELVLKEHRELARTKKKKAVFDDAMSSFFRNFDGQNHELFPKGSTCSISHLKARAILVDMEEGVISQLLKSELGEIFDNTQLISDVSGAGNNWAHGHFYYGGKYRALIVDKIKRAVEACDSLQSFILLHSIGGGTGSGLGTYILKILEEMYPKVYRFAISVFPSKDDYVVTSPYNSIFSLKCLYDHADCVFPVDNEALQTICETASAPYLRVKPTQGTIETDRGNVVAKVKGSSITETGAEVKKTKPFDKMNNIVAHLLSNLTSSMRFEGKLNIDLNEITMNLVPYPKMHFLLSSMAPLYTLADSKLLQRSLDQSFKDVLASDHQLITSTPLAGKYAAIGLFLRGDITIGDVSRNIEKMKKDVKMIYWNKEGFKYGLCDVAPVGQQRTILCLANNTGINEIFREAELRFEKMYKRKVYVHHFTRYMEASFFEEAIETVRTLSRDYTSLERVEEPEIIPRYRPLF